MTSRRGFTLVEMMIAASISVLVLGGTLSAFIGIQRLAAAAVAETEIAVNLRLTRDKLLYRLTPTGTGWLSAAEEPNLAAYVGQGWLNPSVSIDESAVGSLYIMQLEMSAGGVTGTQRVVVPAFGRAQADPGEALFDE